MFNDIDRFSYKEKLRSDFALFNCIYKPYKCTSQIFTVSRYLIFEISYELLRSHTRLETGVFSITFQKFILT